MTRVGLEGFDNKFRLKLRFQRNKIMYNIVM